ncbi:RNA-binding protein 7 isoform X2 [Sesamum indicum]|uniref:RNA-binding protein 7 isoform X2 n=1 Tax=Sesamum indicum TaxID=4182 RepID=A0A8M8UM92_SESIN|nr:RNA-binding protein 7 isoform X2 [Sesamum indicum]
MGRAHSYVHWASVLVQVALPLFPLPIHFTYIIYSNPLTLSLSLSLSKTTTPATSTSYSIEFLLAIQLMADNSNSTVYIGNLDERVSDRVLYDILIQAGRLVDLYIPRDKDTDKPKGYAFAQYESEEIAHYAVNLFSGLVTLYRRTLKFAISGQDKSSLRPDKSSLSVPISSTPTGSSSLKSRPYNAPYNSTEFSSPSPRFSEHKLNYAQVVR